MSTINPALGRLLAGCGGVLLIASLFMPWSGVAGVTRTGWEAVSVWDVFVLITGVCGIAAAITGGRFGFFRRDLSFNGMTDIFGVSPPSAGGWSQRCLARSGLSPFDLNVDPSLPQQVGGLEQRQPHDPRMAAIDMLDE